MSYTVKEPGSVWLVRGARRGAREEIGGKAAGLFALADLDLRVPPFAVLTAAAYRRFFRGAEMKVPLPAPVEAALDEVWTDLDGANHPLAVRSSAVEEDGAQRSFAGQMESFLGVRTRAALSEAVAGCWKSLHGARAEVYRRKKSAAGEQAQDDGEAIAVVIQSMIAAEAAGVIFTVNPVSGRRDEVVVNALWGLGEALVSGELDADTFLLDRQGVVKNTKIARKDERRVPAETGGTVRTRVSPELVDAPSLGEETLQELLRGALRVEAAAGTPQDIEFAVAGGEIFFLQARPVTALGATPDGADAKRQVWDNSNIVESYPGLTLPLTFSFIRRAYRAVYWQFCEVLGLEKKQIGENEEMLANMVGMVRGRVYYNLLNWYRLVSLLPGYRFNKRFMEGMMGVRHPEELPAPVLSRRDKYLVELPRILLVGLRCLFLQATLERRIRSFHRRFGAAHRRFASLDYDSLPPREVLAQYNAIERDVLWHWKAPIINDFSAMIFYGILSRITKTWGVDPSGALHNSLMSRQGGIESTEVASALERLAALIRAEGDLASRLLVLSPGQALRHLEENATLKEEFRRYLDRFGDRCIAELKLESKTTREDPAFCIAMLQNYLRPHASAGGEAGSRGEPERLEAEAQVEKRLRGRFTSWGISRLRLYRWVLKNARAAVRNRENQRLARTRAFAVARRMFRSIGDTWARTGALGEGRDVFYLSIDEIREGVAAPEVPPDFRDRIDERKNRYQRYRSEPPPPEHIIIYGDPADDAPLVESLTEVDRGSTLRGLGACPGIVERAAVVLLEPDTTVRLDGEILVAPQTDPGWVLLFPSIGGLVVERGSMLSHSAIVAREMGIPAVVGVRGAVTAIRTGDRLRIDGSRGTVEILS